MTKLSRRSTSVTVAPAAIAADMSGPSKFAANPSINSLWTMIVVLSAAGRPAVTNTNPARITCNGRASSALNRPRAAHAHLPK
jgi:hypothetical protein